MSEKLNGSNVSNGTDGKHVEKTTHSISQDFPCKISTDTCSCKNGCAVLVQSQETQGTPTIILPAPKLSQTQFNPYFAVGTFSPNKVVFKGKAVIVIDGPIGAGKSTLLDLIVNKLNTLINPLTGKRYVTVGVTEPVKEWQEVGIFEKFSNDKKTYTYPFQTFTLITRLQKIINAVLANPGADIMVIERSILTDRFIFMKGLEPMIDAGDVQMYYSWYSLWSQISPIDFLKSNFIYLRTDVDVTMVRIQKRGRKEEILHATPKAPTLTRQVSSETPMVSVSEDNTEQPNGKPMTLGKLDEKSSGKKPKHGVTEEIQQGLLDAHDTFFGLNDGSHFPDQYRPTLNKENVSIIMGKLANADFTESNSVAFETIFHQHVEPILKKHFHVPLPATTSA